MRESSHEYILHDTDIQALSYVGLLKHVQSAASLDPRDFDSIYPIELEINAGLFSKTINAIAFPTVAVSQVGTSLITSCSCDHSNSQFLCPYQAEIIFSILERSEIRLFFDPTLRRQKIHPVAKGYGLENEPDLDVYFELAYQNGAVEIQPRLKELMKLDAAVFNRELLPIQPAKVASLAKQDTEKKQILVIGHQRFYNKLHIQVMESDVGQSGKIKNPLTTIDTRQLIWKSQDLLHVKFYTAVSSFQDQYTTEHGEAQFEALKVIVANSMGLKTYYHDKSIAEKISAKSLVPIALDTLQAEIELHVFKKEPFYEITGQLVFHDSMLPFTNVVVRNEYFVVRGNRMSLVSDSDMLRVIKFFKRNNEKLLIHSSKYEEFLQTVLAPLAQRIQIHYSYIKAATAVELAEKSYERAPLIYLHQEGNYISITPVMRYGAIEVPVYSRQQLLDTDQNGNVFQVARDQAAELQLTTLVMQQHPDFEQQLQEHEYFYLHKDAFLDDSWFLDAFELWRQAGATILGFNELKVNTLNPHKAKVDIQVISGVDWFNAHVKVRFGRQQASLKQLHRAIRHKRKFVQLDDGTQGLLPEEWMQKIAGYFQVGDIDKELIKIPKVNFTAISDLFEKEMRSEEVEVELAAYAQQFLQIKQIPEVPVPVGLHATLRRYQQEGLNWLNLLDQFSFGGCLADDMGLGKTIQVIAFILSQRDKHTHHTNLIVVPTSLLSNWQDELTKFAPSISVRVHYGADRSKNTDDMHDYEVILTSYGMLLSDIRWLKEFRFNYIFLDESQAIKNPNSERYKAACLLQSRNRIVLTGTPIENNTFDLYGQLSFACPGLLGSKSYFRDVYALPIDKFQYNKRAVELQEKIRPFMLRRTKKQVAKELPEKTEIVIFCEMNATQREIYDRYERELREYISATDEDEIHKNGMHVLTGLTRLRQICNSPVLLKEGYSGADAVKIDVLMEQIVNKSGEHKILIFSQFVGMLDLIRTELENSGIPFEYLTGQTKDRGPKVDNFQANEHIRVFLISLKAGGTGLNLTEADYVYLIDPWWNPAVENQAIDRSYRIGQTKNVIAVRLICSDTIEEKIRHLQQRKHKLAQDMVKTDGLLLRNFSKNDLLDIL
ncbi:ATP-dependent helicase [Sphingobacterium alkalisoli]|uniref:ATP-dependent helicase n=1 Tax=Sphingobacterium alkalisoli TaxID=1874115 RepID=A0A4U0GUF2_9SPHI|nr:DEAD/DEAH box helicase [Sphingobacterium alkalisoli]TJY61342.1 ATP-dependent helicase [Sphingobacterium alkalisoli]